MALECAQANDGDTDAGARAPCPWRAAVAWLALFTVGLGLAYPLALTGAAHLLFPNRAAGSLILADGRAVGSAVVGQPCHDASLFWGRPAAPPFTPGQPAVSGGSNLGPTNPALRAALVERLARLRAADPDNDRPVPIDLVTASASGLDPHISPAAARYQASRVAGARGLPLASVLALIDAHVETPALGFLGQARVNVLRLNLALIALAPAAPKCYPSEGPEGDPP